ncbi:MAG: hypothetical protein H6828_07800 [Planctomycetes bacterium]|nr:hypothetical protein [Planctomycetota bacterium]
MSTTLSALRTALLLAASFAPAAAQQPPAPDDGAAPPPQPQRGPADPSEDAFRFGSPPALPEGTTQEQMWPSATAEQWAQPCLVTWQRTFDDALKVANARHQPILVAVNMDGEIASEHFAGVRYREPETAARMSRYACVIASVYRHTPRDYDPDGKRVECPRFGTVTCGEHIEAERELYDKYFDGKRISPRHIVLDLDGGETYDVYFSWDTDTVFKEFVAGVEGWPEPLPPAEPTIENLARSAAVDDRLRLERTYAEADRETKRAILVALCEPAAVDQLEVLRAALFGFDLELAKLGRRALATCETDGALDLMAEALKVPLEADEREALLGAVERLSATLPRARTLAALHRGLAQGSRLVAPAGTPESFAREYEANAAALGLARRADAVEAAPAEPAALLELAEAYLDRALRREDRFALVNLQDAQRWPRARRSSARRARGSRPCWRAWPTSWATRPPRPRTPWPPSRAGCSRRPATRRPRTRRRATWCASACSSSSAPSGSARSAPPSAPASRGRPSGWPT